MLALEAASNLPTESSSSSAFRSYAFLYTTFHLFPIPTGTGSYCSVFLLKSFLRVPEDAVSICDLVGTIVLSLYLATQDSFFGTLGLLSLAMTFALHFGCVYSARSEDDSGQCLFLSLISLPSFITLLSFFLSTHDLVPVLPLPLGDAFGQGK